MVLAPSIPQVAPYALHMIVGALQISKNKSCHMEVNMLKNMTGAQSSTPQHFPDYSCTCRDSKVIYPSSFQRFGHFAGGYNFSFYLYSDRSLDAQDFVKNAMW